MQRVDAGSHGPQLWLWRGGEVWLMGIPSSNLPSSKHTKNYGKSPFIVSLSIKNGDFP